MKPNAVGKLGPRNVAPMRRVEGPLPVVVGKRVPKVLEPFDARPVVTGGQALAQDVRVHVVTKAGETRLKMGARPRASFQKSSRGVHQHQGTIRKGGGRKRLGVKEALEAGSGERRSFGCDVVDQGPGIGGEGGSEGSGGLQGAGVEPG